jgi:hypothetical protein
MDDRLVYHEINRGNNRQNVFRKRADFTAFLIALLPGGKTCCDR